MGYSVFHHLHICNESKLMEVEKPMHDFKIYYVRSQRLAGFLMMKGFVLQFIKPVNDGSNRNLFCFKDSEQLVAKIQEYKQMKEVVTNG